jgi:hypothetical protein
MTMKTDGHVFRVGDRVRVRLGPQSPVGTIVEDRGRIGAGGRRLFRIEVLFDRTNLATIEVPEDELTAAE